MPKINIDGRSIYYEVYGEGEPLILLNGMIMSTMSWLPHVKALSARYKLILMDLICQGQSEILTRDLTHDMQVEAVKGVLDHLRVEKVHMFGASYGAQVALRFAIMYQQRLKSLALEGVTAQMNPHAIAVGESWLDIIKLHDAEKTWTMLTPQAYGPDFFNNNLNVLNERMKLFKQTITDAWYDGIVALVNSCRNLDLLDRVHEIKVPALIMAGEDDTIIPIKYQIEVYKRIKGCAFVTIKDSGHCPYVELPRVFQYILIGFLEIQKSNNQ